MVSDFGTVSQHILEKDTCFLVNSYIYKFNILTSLYLNVVTDISNRSLILVVLNKKKILINIQI